MNENNKKFIYISKQDDLDYLIKRIDNGSFFAEAFKFEEYDLFLSLLEYLKINYEDFKKGYFYYDKSRNLHISESESKYVWISTYGLVAEGKSTDNNLVNACVNQYAVLSLLLENAIDLMKSENIYDVDGYNFGYLSKLTPALFHNILFYIEVFFKAYLSLSGAEVPRIHELSKIYSLVIKSMYKKKHNDTLFQAFILDEFKKIIDYIASIPGDFKEQFVKYDDNSGDSTVIVFNPESLNGIKYAIDKSNDFIYSYYYEGDNSLDLKSGLFERLINKTKTEDEKQRIIDRYSHLITKNYKE